MQIRTAHALTDARRSDIVSILAQIAVHCKIFLCGGIPAEIGRHDFTDQPLPFFGIMIQRESRKNAVFQLIHIVIAERKAVSVDFAVEFIIAFDGVVKAAGFRA